MRIYRLLAVSFAGLSAVPAVSLAQQMPQPDVYWAASYFQIQFPRVDSLRKLLQAYTFPIVDEQKKMGTLLDYRVLIHSWGGRDNVVIMQKYGSFGAIGSDTTFRVAYRRVVPDSTKRKAIDDGFNWVFESGLHRDEIYTEVVKK